jgi:pSer/pThr/pTyr-binding forkhead associated (FHA) protein
MSDACNGELVPVGGGDPIPLIRPVLTIGRRDSCDICLRFPNVSGTHCELAFQDGRWLVRDLDSTNGTKVNGLRVRRKVLFPQDAVSIADHRYTIDYVPARVSRVVDEIIDDEEEILKQPLLERAGLVHAREDRNRRRQRPEPSSARGGDSATSFGASWKSHPPRPGQRDQHRLPAEEESEPEGRS